ncbi:hypothetical protein COCNU_09G003970 [Cocos nucifera]|uniref:Uncharacterized protein n=1 Tax=Cocos nucifera TaxID=13894 RepID=A0A8K0N7A1_COCNU|nr:hypothetical protein COCNU_09G003970 [Cocos nucifera]
MPNSVSPSWRIVRGIPQRTAAWCQSEPLIRNGTVVVVDVFILAMFLKCRQLASISELFEKDVEFYTRAPALRSLFEMLRGPSEEQLSWHHPILGIKRSR